MCTNLHLWKRRFEVKNAMSNGYLHLRKQLAWQSFESLFLRFLFRIEAHCKVRIQDERFDVDNEFSKACIMRSCLELQREVDGFEQMKCFVQMVLMHRGNTCGFRNFGAMSSQLKKEVCLILNI